MKKLQQITFLLLLVTIAASCGNSDNSPLAKKKDELAKLKSDRKTLNDKILKLEGEIALLDSNSANSKGKLVSVKSMEAQAFTNYIEIMGKIDADQNTNVSCEIPGTLQKINVVVGQSVSLGQTLGEIDNTTSAVAMNELKTTTRFRQNDVR
jgi:membrane fusion protein (multidrug efflux system)